MTRGINTGAIRIEQQRRHHHGIERWLSPAAWRKADWDNTTGRSPSRQLVGEVYLRTLDRHPLMPISGLITFTRLAAVPPAPFGGNLSLDPATVGAHFLPPRYSAVENVPNLCEFAIPSNHRYLPAMRDAFDPEDFSFVVKMRGAPPKPWAWEIHRAGKSGPVERSSVFYNKYGRGSQRGEKSPRTHPHQGAGAKATGWRRINGA